MRYSKCICIAVELCWQLEFFTFLVAVLMALDMFQVRGMGQCFEAVLNFIYHIPVGFEGFIGKVVIKVVAAVFIVGHHSVNQTLGVSVVSVALLLGLLKELQKSHCESQ